MADWKYDIQFAMVPMWLLECGASLAAIGVFAALGKYANNGKAWPGRRRLAADVKVSTGTVDRALKELRLCGAITICGRRREDGSTTSNEYQLHVSKPAELTLMTPLITGDHSPDHGRSGPLITGDQAPSSPVIRHELDPREPDPINQKRTAQNAVLSPKAVLAEFDRQWTAKYGRAYEVAKADGPLAVRNGVVKLQPDDVRLRISRYLRRTDKFYFGHPFKLFAADLNRWTVGDSLANEPPRLPTIEEIREKRRRQLEALEADDAQAH